MSKYQEHSERIVTALNQLIDIAEAYRKLLNEELRALEDKENSGHYHQARMRRRVISEIDDLTTPLEELVFDRVLRVVDRVQSLETIDRDEDFV